MSGLTFIQRMREEGLLEAVPVIVLTSENDPKMQEACRRVGSSAYLQKPIDPELLYQTVQKISETAPRAHIRLRTSLCAIIGDGSPLGGAARTEEVAAISEGGMYVRSRTRSRKTP